MRKMRGAIILILLSMWTAEAGAQSVEVAPPAPAAPAPPAARARLSNDELFGPQRQLLSFNIGLAAPLSSVDFSAIGGGSAANGDVGPLLGLQDLYSLTPRWAFGAEAQYALRPWTYSPGLLPNSGASVSGETALLLAELKYSLTDRGRRRPYLLFGVGPGWNTTTIDARPNWGYSWPNSGTWEQRRLVNGGAWALAETARLGIDFDLPWSNVFSVEGGWTGLTSEHYAATVQGQALGLSGVTAPLNYFTLGARLGWRF